MKKHFLKITVLISTCFLTAVLLTGCSKSIPFPHDTVTSPLSLSPSVTSAPTSSIDPASRSILPIPTTTPSPIPIPGPDFYRVSGCNIINSVGMPIQLKGIAMGNMIWGYYDPPANDHNKDSFRELSELGFNCIRFYLSYHFFEKDAEPYVYKESGFDWLDENIAWAKKHGIRLILNMHAPQGGYQSQGEGLALWQNEENQQRLIALWTEIARRYAHEETIIGYGLINEPVVPFLSDKESTIAQCTSLMQRITDSIRTVDTNHIIFVERLCAMVDPVTGESNWSFTYDDILTTINDTNAVYEFHCYSPHKFTHQNMDWAGTGGITGTYPSDEVIFSDAISYWTGCIPSYKTEDLDDGWSYFLSDFATLSKDSNVGSVTLQASGLGAEGIALFDDIVVSEYQNGTFQRIITTLDFESDQSTDNFNYWSADGSGSYSFATTGYNNSPCLMLSGTTADANVTGFRFPLKEGCEYQISGKVKTINAEKNASARPRIDYSLFGTVTYLDASYLESELLPYITFGQNNRVPIYLGEFGVCIPAFESNTGAVQWVTDMLTLCNQYNLHFNYHAYHDYWFGLYRLPTDDPDRKINEELAEVFRELLN